MSNTSPVNVYFDDVQIIYAPSNVIQYNEYYPFGLQAATSWTRDNSSNNFLYNAGSELNNTSGWYETFFRGYDAALGRFLQVDPLASASASWSPYHYGKNNPVVFNDPMGDRERPPQDRFQPYTDMCWECWEKLAGLAGGPGNRPVFGAYGGWVPMTLDEFNRRAITGTDAPNGATWSGGYAHYFRGQDEAYGFASAYLSAIGGWGDVPGGQAAADSRFGGSPLHNKSIFVSSIVDGRKVMRYVGPNRRYYGGFGVDRSQLFHFVPEAYEFWAYKQMLSDQSLSQKEISAYLVVKKGTNERGVLIQPWAKNTHDGADPYIGLNFGKGVITDHNGVEYILKAILPLSHSKL